MLLRALCFKPMLRLLLGRVGSHRTISGYCADACFLIKKMVGNAKILMSRISVIAKAFCNA